MKFGRTTATVLVAGCALSASVLAQPTSTPAQAGNTAVLPANPVPARLIPTYQYLPSGEKIPVKGNPNAPRPRGAVVGYNNQDCEGCAAPSDVPGFGLNVAYVEPGSYDGSNPSTTASIFGLGDGPEGSSLRAPSNAGAGIPLPTDIVWDDYTGDETVWPGGAKGTGTVSEYSFVTVRVNQTAVERIDTYRVLFFTADGTTFLGGFEFDIPIEPMMGYYQQVLLDLTTLTPPLELPITGLQMVDVLAPAEGQPAIGVGLAFAGGDLVNANYPTPESLVLVGANLSGDWLFADGETGAGGPPNVVDPMFDGMEGVSYLDVLNTGFLVDWQFTSTAPGGKIGTRTFAHAFPSRMTVGEGVAIGACVLVDSQFCFLSTEPDCVVQGGVFLGGGTVCGDFFGACCLPDGCQDMLPSVCTALGGTYLGDNTFCGGIKCPAPGACPCDFNQSGDLNSQDFFDFLTAFFTEAEGADFNGDGSINSQDFFDFLTCFFDPPKDCGA